MDTSDFVANVVRLKEDLLESFVADVACRLAELGLTAAQRAHVRTIIDAVLRDTLYTVLLGLDGAAPIGDLQQPYRLTDDSGELVYRAGELEAEAWRQLQSDA